MDEGRMKALTGQDDVSARLMRENPRTFRPRFKLVLATNHLPNVRDESDGYWSRVRLIPFERQFLESPDPHLRETLLAEAPTPDHASDRTWPVRRRYCPMSS